MHTKPPTDREAPTMPPSKADADAAEFERRLKALEKRSNSGMFRVLAEAKEVSEGR